MERPELRPGAPFASLALEEEHGRPYLSAMDTVTQMLFGATVAQVGFRRRLGRKAIAAGALLGLVPDLDVAAGWLAGPFVNWVHHRGVTHSLFFGPAVGLLLAGALWLWWRRREPDRRPDPQVVQAWVWLTVLALLTHPVIDVFTSYGTQLLAPFSRHRFAINAMPIIDPIYSLALVVALSVGLFARRHALAAQVSAAAALLFIGGWTLLGWSINDRVEEVVRKDVSSGAEVTAYPTLFQPWLRRVVVEAPQEVRVGFYSVLAPKPIAWATFSRDGLPPAARAVAATEQAEIFRWFAMDNVFWRVEQNGTGGAVVEALDYRYGMFGGTELGMWGIRAVVDASGRLAGEPEAFTRRPQASEDRLRLFWTMTFGATP